MSFSRKVIRTTFTMQQGTFASGTNTVTQDGLRTLTKIVNAGGPTMGRCQALIFGMPLERMNQISTLGMKMSEMPRAVFRMEAGEEGKNLTTVFLGNIITANPIFQGMPEVALAVDAQVLAAAAAIPIAPQSFTGQMDVGRAMSSLATQMGLSFENNGVTTQLSNANYWGDARTQAQRIVDDAGINWNGGEGGVLAIWPRGGYRRGAVPLITPETGLIGYPEFNAEGVAFSCQFNPQIGFGGRVELRSDLTRANGTWTILGMDHELDSMVDHGLWQTNIRCYIPEDPRNSVVAQR